MGIVDLIFPRICVGCGREGQYICLDCEKKLVRPESMCPMCCKPSLDGWTHSRCKTRFGMERLLVGLPYRGMVQNCLKKVKYKSSWDILDFLFHLCQVDMEGEVVTAVPMFAQKTRERGFDQAEILGQLVAKQYKGRFFVLLTRVRETKPMFGLNKEKRRINVEGAFRILDHLPITLIDQRIILVDDVWTTGATMRECARVLKRAGMKEVWGVTLAR